MRGEMLSILSMFECYPEIFDGLTLPEVSDLDQTAELIQPIEPLDKELLIGTICMDLAELSLVYTDPDALQKMITIWSTINRRNWLKLWETMLYKYNPIWNKDGKIADTRYLNRSGSSSGTQDDSTGNTSNTTDSRTVENNVTGYDTNAYSPNTQDTEDGTVNTRATGTLARETANQFSEHEDEGYTRVEQGNIGVTTSQQMIKEQRELVQFNLYEFITAQFKERFCVMVY